MIFREIYLYPDLSEYSDKTVIPFRNQSRSICNYLQRQVSLLRFKSDGFSRVCFIGRSQPNANCYVNSSNVLIVELDFDESYYLSLHLHEAKLNKYFSKLLDVGIRKAESQFDIPAEELRHYLAQFEKGQYVNEWCFKKKNVKELGIKCSLDCRLTISNFFLQLSIFKGSDIIWQKEILVTEPDELAFSHKFKDILFDGNSVVVTNKFGKTMFSLTKSELGI